MFITSAKFLLLSTILFMSCALVTGCSGGNSAAPTATGGLGAISAKLAVKGVNSLPANVATVRLIVSGAEMDTIQRDFPAANRSGVIDGIPVGISVIVSTISLDASGNFIHVGSVSNITVLVGQTTDVGTVSMQPLSALTSLTVTPANASMAVGATRQFSAIGNFTDTSAVDMTSIVTWNSSSASVAAISNGTANGMATALAAGAATISAKYGSITGATSLTVLGSNSALTTDAISGKTFSFNTSSGSTGTLTFAADNTWSGMQDGYSYSAGTWTINSSGQLIVTKSGKVNTLTLTSSTATTMTFLDSWTQANTTPSTGSGTITLTLIPNNSSSSTGKYVLNTTWASFLGGTTQPVSFSQLIQFYNISMGNSGNILGFGHTNSGMQFSANGTVYFYSVKYLPNGYIDESYTPRQIATGYWKYEVVGGVTVAVIDTSPIRSAAPYNIIFGVYNGVLYGGYVMPGPASDLPQSALFTNGMLSGKTLTILDSPGGTGYVALAANGTASVTSQNGTSSTSTTWAVNPDGTVSIGTQILTITSGSGQSFQVVYTSSIYKILGASSQQVGPSTLIIQ